LSLRDHDQDLERGRFLRFGEAIDKDRPAACEQTAHDIARAGERTFPSCHHRTRPQRQGRIVLAVKLEAVCTAARSVATGASLTEADAA
jgi:hypothetical protein